MAKTGERNRKSGMILAVLAGMAMMVMFIEIMLVPALPTLAQDFPDDVAWIPWVLSIYMLVGAVATPLVGRLGDIHGKKRVLSYVMVVYFLALVGCGFSLEISDALLGHHSIFVLLFFRAVQGIGMGMFTLAFGIVRDTFPLEKVPVAIGLISAMFSVGVGIGLLGGGYITSVASWTDAFLIVAPLFGLLTIAAYFLIHDPLLTRRGSLDVPGAMTLGIGVLAFLLALTQGEEWGWTSSAVVALFATAAISTALFIAVERRSEDPVIRPSLLANRGMLGGNVVALFVGLCMFMVYQTVPFFLQTPVAAGGLFGLSNTFTVGLYLLPSALAQFFVGPLGGRFSRSLGSSNVLAIGMATLTAGFVCLVFLHADFWQLTVSMLVFGAGVALCMVSMINVVVDSCSREEFGAASGMNTLFRIIGGSIGPVLAAVVLAGYAFDFQVAPGISIQLWEVEGYVHTWWLGFAFAVIGLVAALVLRPRTRAKADAPKQSIAEI